MTDAPRSLAALLDEGRHPDDLPAALDPRDRRDRGALRDAADRLHTVLADAGVRPGDRVGVSLETTVTTAVAVHGVLRAGAVVVPLDPRAPAVHVGGILDDVDIDVLVTDAPARRLTDLVAHRRLRLVVGVDDGPPGTAGMSWDAVATAPPSPRRDPSPHDRAYVITTSGSTGPPKGIVHTHASGLAYARLAAATYDLGPRDVVATLGPLHFDQSTFSVYAAPLAGAAALFVPDAVLRFPASLTEVVADREATVLYTVPTLLQQVLRRGVLAERDLGRVRWVLYGGEPFPPEDLGALMRALPGARVSNVYGPAEVNQCTYEHLDEPPPPGAPVPIGRAWAETEVLVVGPDGAALGPGAEGEILVSSSTAMEGYWRAPERTAAVFSERPGVDGSLRRWYATGDIGRWLDDGRLVFVGRADNQVKVRGQRVELEAVDAALAGQPGVDLAVAVATPSAEGGHELVGLVTPSDPASPPEPRALRAALARGLPPAAVPAAVRVVAALPRTTSGKVDRRGARNLLEASPDQASPDQASADQGRSDQLGSRQTS